MNRDAVTDRDELIFRNSLNTYLYEAEMCLRYDLGYPAILLIDAVLQFVADLKGQQAQDIIAQMDKFTWLVSWETDRQKIAELVCDHIDGCKVISPDAKHLAKSVMVRDRSRIDNNLIPNFHILILDEFFLELKDLALDEVSSL